MDPPKPQPSRWERRRRSWYRGAARTRIQENSWYAIAFLALPGFFLVISGFRELDQPIGWLSLAGGALALASLWGLWTGREWARWIGGLVCLGLGLLGLVSVLWRASDWGFLLLKTVIWLEIAVFLLRPATRHLFHQARTGQPPPA